MRYAVIATFIALALTGCATLSSLDTTTTPTATGFTTQVFHPSDQDPALGCGAGAWGACPPWLEWPR